MLLQNIVQAQSISAIRALFTCNLLLELPLKSAISPFEPNSCINGLVLFAFFDDAIIVDCAKNGDVGLTKLTGVFNSFAFDSFFGHNGGSR